jgi:regulator of sirC expression with transglutaminase-like and TPR domain
MTPRDAFAALVERDDEQIDLARAALLFAAVEYPDLDVGAYLARLDRLAAELRPRVSPEESPGRVVAAIDEYLFGEQGFRGNELEYYDPRNSYLNEVLDRRLGIPISLSVVYLEVARRVGFRLEGVGMPGHFLLRHPDPVQPLLIDAFNRGAIVTEDDCRARLRGLYGDALPLTAEMLRPVDARTILFRMLNNLKGIYARREDFARAVRTVDLMLLVEPGAVGEYRDRGALRFRAADFKLARADLEHYLEARPDPPDAEAVREQIALIDRLDEMKN